MTHADAVALIGGTPLTPSAQTWADLGCGDGVFTLALASILPPGSVIHAVDRDASTLRRLPRAVGAISIVPHAADFTSMPWPFRGLDGALLANSLHFVRDQATFIDQATKHIRSPQRFLIVEYDTDRPNRWVPHPVSQRSLGRLFEEAGYASFTPLGTHPSVYQRAPLYAALISRLAPAAPQAGTGP